MSSVQQVRNHAQINDKEKAEVNEAIKEAKSFLANNNNNVKAANQYQLALVSGSIKNRQNRAIRFYDSKNFKGKFLVEPPKDGNGNFVHQGDYSVGPLPMVVGSKAGVKYGHIDKLPNALGYVLAWDNPDHANGSQKVYVIAGAREKIMNMDWCEIEQNLDASGSESRYPEIGISVLAYAKIEDMGNKLAALGATFYDQFPHQS